MTPAEKKQLITDHLDRAEKVTNSVLRITPESNPQLWEDAVAVARLAIVEAAEHWDPNAADCAPFGAYATQGIRVALWRFTDRERTRCPLLRVAGQRHEAEDEQGGIDLPSGSWDPHEALTRVRQEAALALVKESPYSPEAVIARLVDETSGRITKTELAKAAGISRQAVTGILCRLFERVVGHAPEGKRLKDAPGDRYARYARNMSPEKRAERSRQRVERRRQARQALRLLEQAAA